MSSKINHVSVNARDLQASVDFYVDLLGAEPIDTPNFGFPVQWLALGRTQLHLFQRDLQPTSHHDFAVAVDEVEPVYRRRSGARRSTTRRSASTSWSSPATSCSSTFATPPATWSRSTASGVDRLPSELRAQLKHLWEFHPQDDANASAALRTGVSYSAPWRVRLRPAVLRENGTNGRPRPGVESASMRVRTPP